ncbi:36.4 kDa proline-rich protein [Cocos nucifera]|uniref:36.4 kDa proline-rich protein n=1 Tax=Cocos nucifera TaxID=13894 RepID=A0A8K0HXD0_COCNU|nr:36.4 kDa proline-rich protein [Cocos nucifera]
MLFISSTPIALACGTCPTPSTPKTPPTPKTPRTPPAPKTPPPPKGGITLPPIIGMPPITLPPIIGMPPITLPPIIGKPPINLPPITLPPIIPPIIGTPPTAGTPPPTKKPGCGAAPPPATTCPIDALKLGACVDLLGSTVHVGDPALECCSDLAGLAGVQAAACLCTTIKAKLLDINVYLPIALQLLVTCGNSAPPGYTCPK